jgi:hypothetical protein
MAVQAPPELLGIQPTMSGAVPPAIDKALGRDSSGEVKFGVRAV